MTRVILFQFIIFLLCQLNIFNCIRAQDEVVKCTIQDGNIVINLNWKKTEQLLLNKNLPIWVAKSSKNKNCEAEGRKVNHKLKPNYMKKNFGDFVLYHDTEKSSAVVYFKDTETISGMIDTRYVIKNLPITECNPDTPISNEYIERRLKDFDAHAYLKQLNLSNNSTEQPFAYPEKPSTSTLDEPPKKRQKLNDNGDEKEVTIFYPEILLLIPYDFINIIKPHEPNYLKNIINHFIIYFNAVDMVLSKLSTDYIKIHLNLAGFIFEDHPGIFPFLKLVHFDPPRIVNGQQSHSRFLDAHASFDAISNYMNAHRDTFLEDSFDFFFVPSADILWASLTNFEIFGASNPIDIYLERKKIPFMRRVMGLMAYHGDGCEFGLASHELGHLLGINHESCEKGYTDGFYQCYAIMQSGGVICQDCLRWTDQSVSELETFAKENRNRCFLLNEPRSLYPYGSTMKSSKPSEQCRCYGLSTKLKIQFWDNIDEIADTDCGKTMMCSFNSQAIPSLLPLDGTPCFYNKVCWNNKCRGITQVPDTVLQERPHHT